MRSEHKSRNEERRRRETACEDLGAVCIARLARGRRVARGCRSREISKVAIAWDRGSRGIRLELVQGLRSVCGWAARTSPSVGRKGSDKGECALDDHDHALVAVLCLLAEEPDRLG